VRYSGASGPSEYSVPLLGDGRYRRGAVLSEFAARSEFEPVVVSPVWVGRSRFAVGHSLGCAVFLAAGPAATVKQSHEPLFRFRSPPEYYPADPSQPAAADQHLSWAFVPFSTPGFGGPLFAGLPTRFVPPAGFGDPLGGLLPPSPCRFCFTPAALLGFTLRSFLLPQGSRTFPRGSTHIPFFLPLLPPPKQRAGPAGRGFWALTLARVPGDRARD